MSKSVLELGAFFPYHCLNKSKLTEASIMEKVTIQVIKTGEVRIVPELAFGGDHCSMIKASGVFASDKKREWFPVNVFLVDHPKHGKLLLDTG